MAGEELPDERLQVFLRDLKPEARALLLAELERGALGGDKMPAADILLAELRRDLRRGPTEFPRANRAARLFFAPVEPFLVDDGGERQRLGRIARSFLDGLWQWICRDLMAAEAVAFRQELERVLVDPKTAERLVRNFQDLAIQRIREALAAVEHDDRTRRRLAGQIGSPRALDELHEVMRVLMARDALALVASRLPPSIRNLADEQLDNVKALLDSPIARHPDVFVYALLVAMSRLGAPWQLVRLAVKAAESDLAQRIAETPYAVAVTIVLGEIERMVGDLRGNMKRGQMAAVANELKDIHDAVRLLRSEINLSGDSPWARQLAALRADVSNLVKAEIESVPGRMRRLLRPRPAKDIAANSALDATDIDETEALIEFAGVCRNYASELAINEVTLRVQSELQNYLDTGTSPLLDALRNATDSDRRFRLSQVEAAVRFAGKVFGASYASLLVKAAEVASHGAERKTAKA